MRRPELAWIPTLYIAEGLPYIIVMSVSGVMLKNLGLSNSETAAYASSLGLVWVFKPFWSPLVDQLLTRRQWVLITQGLLALGLLGSGVSLGLGYDIGVVLAGLWVMAIASATHDIAADGLYMLGLTENKQAFYVGFRSAFYRVGMWLGEGVMVILAGYLAGVAGKEAGGEGSEGIYRYAWQWTFVAAAVFMGLIAWWHSKFLPRSSADHPGDSQSPKALLAETLETFVSFFRRPKMGVILGFLLMYRFGEAQLVRMVPLFLIDPVESGGLALSNQALGWINGTAGLIALTVGGILGGFLAARGGLKAWFWPMILAMNLPNLGYLFLALAQPDGTMWVVFTVMLEKFGYGFGFTAFLLYLLYLARGTHQTAHYAFGTGIMALGMTLPGIVSGKVQEWLGYSEFFLWVMIATLPGMMLGYFVWRELDSEFGKRDEGKS